MPDEADGRSFIERIWQDCAQYLDTDLAERAPANGLVSAFWEIYLAHALKTNGARLVPRSKRMPKREGPDLFAEMPDVWTEAYAATPGKAADALEWGHGRVPNDRFILRLCEAIDKKGVQLAEHRRRGFIKTAQATVIAISGAMLPYRWSEPLVPRIVSAVLGVGDLVLEFERATMTSVGRSLEYRDEVSKLSKASVKTDLFLGDRLSHVSAVLYSRSCWMDHPEIPGAEFIVVHNPHAQAPLPDGWFPLGKEYWLDGSAVKYTRHAIHNDG